MRLTIRFSRPPRSVPRTARMYSTIAPHIRGRVFAAGRTRWGQSIWHYEVINTSTGKVLASDNTAHWSKLFAACDEVTAAARAAWFWEFRQKDMRP